MVSEMMSMGTTLVGEAEGVDVVVVVVDNLDVMAAAVATKVDLADGDEQCAGNLGVAARQNSMALRAEGGGALRLSSSSA